MVCTCAPCSHSSLCVRTYASWVFISAEIYNLGMQQKSLAYARNYTHNLAPFGFIVSSNALIRHRAVTQASRSVVCEVST